MVSFGMMLLLAKSVGIKKTLVSYDDKSQLYMKTDDVFNLLLRYS